MSGRGINPLWFAYEGVGVMGCVGLISACSLTWSDPARSPFRNLHVHSSPRQVEVPPRARVLREWGDGNGDYDEISRSRPAHPY